MIASARIAESVDRDSIARLLANEVDAIHVAGFYPPELSRGSAERIAVHSELESYKTQSTLKRLGMGYVDVATEPGSAGRYHDEAMRSTWTIRGLFYPHISPLDHLRLLLEEVWPAGAGIEALDGRKCFVGTCRVIEPGARMLPHNDRLGRMSAAALPMSGQLAVNIYLEMPEEGGEIELWLSEPTEAQDREMAARDGLDRQTLGAPPLVIRPAVGDLVIFNSRLIHCVTPGLGRQRVTMSCFIGYRGEAAPLTYWS